MKAIELTIQERQQIFVALIGYRNLFRGIKIINRIADEVAGHKVYQS